MQLLISSIVLLYAVYQSNAGYGIPAAPSGGLAPQADVQAPSYVPPNLTHQKFTKTGYSGTKTAYSGYSGTKTAYSGYSGTKTGYTGTKTGYAGTKTGYGGQNSIPGYMPAGAFPPGYANMVPQGNVPVPGTGVPAANPGLQPNMPYTAPRPGGYGSGRNGYQSYNYWSSSSGNAPNFNDFLNNVNKPYSPRCEPECKNNGICVDVNTCNCPPNYTGRYCELEKKMCRSLPPIPMNSNRMCSGDMCTMKCMEGHKFFDGSTIASVRCVEGQWQPTRADLTTLSDCAPQCDPSCNNGGVCLGVNTCQCPRAFKGPQCQYPATVCDIRKLAFNGAYNCSGNDERFSCQLSCPAGATFSHPASALYTCLYSTGVFLPQPIPHCVFNEVIIVTPSNNMNIEGAYYEIHSYGSHVTHGTGGAQVVVQDYSPRAGVCLSWAGTHYKTFDGQIYSFKSSCQHILVRDAREHKFTVAVKHGDCTRHSYCPSELTVYLEDKPYTLSANDDGSVAFRSTKRLIPIPATLPGIRVEMPSDHVLVHLDGLGLTVKWDTNNQILVESSILLWNNTEGLCGTLDGHLENELKTKEGAQAPTKTVMASSWQINKIGDLCEGSPSGTSVCATKSNDDTRKAEKFCAEIFSRDKFRKCSKYMDVALLLQACQWDYCACLDSENPEECACSTVSVYAKECMRHDIEEMRSWRDGSTCPMKCPDGKLYHSCGPDSQPSCAFPNLPVTTGNTTCVEGCFCPGGLLLEGGKCVPKNECPCRLRNKVFRPGATVTKDCNTCTCSGGEWSCTRAACGARCGAVGDPHYTTLDGLKYDFMGHCTYTLLQTANLTVEVENVACSGTITEAMNLAPYQGSGKPSCTKAVSLKYNGATINMKQGGLILVNGREVATLPVQVGEILIRPVSSLFLIVQLPFGVDLWWDGNTRVFVDVPAEFKDKTKGLCGTFNLNQRDDFLTPEGDVEESAVAFANKWKTREFCEDTDTTEPEHPCKANVQNKQTAEKYCSKLTSKLFEACHWYVDVEAYYSECVYDMCACTGEVARCLCPIIGDYAMACARQGVKIQWRYNVQECELQCTGGQEYTVCADSCQRTCSDIALLSAGRCKPSCVEGCACPPGQVLDSNSVCVPIAKCPCFHKGMQFDAGYKEVRPGRRERELCTCVGARWDCLPASPVDIQNYPPAEDLMANCSAANHMEFTTCEIAEPLTCKNMHLPPSTTTTECRPGCQCKKVYVLDASSNKCVLASECPCHHGGRSYPDGHIIQEDCNTCECKTGNWSCSSRPCAGVCTAWGDSHVVTFDNADYDFEGVCTYLLAKGVADDSDGFDVEIQNVPCGTTGATCSKAVTLRIGSGPNEEMVQLTENAPLPNISKLKRIKLRIAGAFVFLDVPSLGMSLQWDRAMRVYVKVDVMWKNRVKGLCGNFNSDMRDDFQAPSSGGMAETSAIIFADSWKLKQTCPKAKSVTEHCQQRPERLEWATSMCGALKRFPFTLCHSAVGVSGWAARCERDACACDAGDDCACACTALAAYADACAAKGVHFKWRTQERCPMQCDEECSNYDDCVSACPLETCDNTEHYSDLKTMCDKNTCIEGCKPKKSCPEGEVYANSSLSECVPRVRCSPVCMTLADGREVLEGEVLEEDACHTCRCSKKQRICTGQPCSTALPIPSEPPLRHDEPLKCVPGWTEWVNSDSPQTDDTGASVDNEPLPKLTQLKIGTSMCTPDMMKAIECRTVVNHETPKQTGKDVECSLERGLKCHETNDLCPDFEIRVLCQCDNATTVASTTSPTTPTPRGILQTTAATVTPSCPPGRTFSNCAFPCDNLCHHFKMTLRANGKCNPGENCADGCTDRVCLRGSVWRDNDTCVPLKDCTCFHDGQLIKPGGVVTEGCRKCQCLNNELHCDTSDCKTTPSVLLGPPNQHIIVQDTTLPGWNNGYTTPTTEPTPTPTLITKNTASPPPECSPLGYTYLLSDQPLTSSAFTASSFSGPEFQPQSVVINMAQPASEEPFQCLNAEHPNHPHERDCGKFYECTPDLLNTQKLHTVVKECPPGLMYHPTLMVCDWPAAVIAVRPECGNGGVGTTTHIPSTEGGWKPKTNDANQYVQVELPHSEPIYGILVQGHPTLDQYVTSYTVTYSDDGHIFYHVDGPDGKPKVFRGPVEHSEPMKQMISPPIDAKFVRLTPLTWHQDIVLKFELIGCQEPFSTTAVNPTITTEEPLQCTEPLGIAADLPIELIVVSSNNERRADFKLNGDKGWKPVYSTPGEWVMFDFQSPRNITGIKTKGGPDGWVTSYNIMYTSDLSTFNPVVDSNGAYKIFPGNFDQNSVVMNEFRPALHARYLKVLPLKWKDAIEMRIEPIGCLEPYVYTTTVIPVTGAPHECARCPGVPLTPCACAPNQYFDGQRCVTRDLCPCIDGFTSYVVGSTFRGSNCDECICKLGGISDCKPIMDCKCLPDLVPKIEPRTCECLCEPCPNGTKICPTSKLCLPLSRWCNGLQDCPDDEINCMEPREPLVVTTVAPTVAVPVPTTTEKPKECPKVQCPPGYLIRYTSPSQSSYSSGTEDLPPPRPRYSYQRYQRGGPGGYGGGGGYAKGGGYSKGGFSKGGYNVPTTNQAFTLNKPSLETQTNNMKQEQQKCAVFRCVPKLPPIHRGSTVAPLECSAPICPPHYTLKLEHAATGFDACPQYVCAPPPERPVYCNVTGRTISTFDGAENKIDLCYHILAREHRLDAWTVLVRKKCRVDGCLNELIVRQDDQLILIKPNLMIEYDNFEYTVEQTTKICFQKNSFDLNKLGNGLSIKSRKYNFTVSYTPDGDIKIGVPKSYMGSVDGLCGSFDGDATNERRLPDGTPAASLPQLARSWAKPGLPPNACKTKVVPPAEKTRVWELCNVVTKQPLSQCASVLSLEKWRTICLEKICECRDLVINGTKRTEEECRCLLLEQMVAECLAADKNLDLNSWRMQNDCPSDCPAPLVHYDCYRKRCEPTCGASGGGGGGGGAPRACPVEDGHCFPGCYCPEGTLRKGDQCVAPADCKDCVCDGMNSPVQFTTFERDDLPFDGNCTYLASRDRNETGYHKYQVYVTNGQCDDNPEAVCTKTIHLLHEAHVIHITKDPETKKLLTMVDQSLMFKYPLEKDWVTITQVKRQDVSVFVPDANLELLVTAAKLEYSVWVPSHVYANRTEGMCGVCNGYSFGLLTANGTYTQDMDEFGKSWQASPESMQVLEIPPAQCGPPPPEPVCVPPPPEQNPCYNLLDQEKFGACHALVDPSTFVESCSMEVCDNRTDVCSALQRYAAECRRQGVCLRWRSPLCPYTCEEPLVYRPCVDCEKTCDNNEELTKEPGKCDQQPVEGCFCPEGKVRVNNTCIEPSKCFPCDANKEHYAGDEWQENACVKCTCVKLSSSASAQVSCTTQTCAQPVCAQGENMISKPTRPGQCCQEYMCVPKPPELHCEEPKHMECGFGQVLKQKTLPSGCKEFACECKPANECERIPSDNEVEILEPGMERLIDNSSCCPRVVLLCKPELCPEAPPCEQFHTLSWVNITGKCCPQPKCELPEGKCIVDLEWEAAPKGGEKARASPQHVLKDVDSVWLDGPCRSCSCSSTGAQCAVTECTAVLITEDFVLEPRPVPFACCPESVQVACRHNDNIYKVGENWTSPYDVCISYQCIRNDDSKLEKVTTKQHCETHCQQGWEYFPAAAGSGKCCGSCKPVACVVDGHQHPIGEKWTSADFCTNYTCLDLNGTLQVQTSNETCTVPRSTQFLYKENKLPGKCCSEYVPTACRVGDKIYQVGENWTSTTDPCVTYMCKNEEGKVQKLTTQQFCDEDCQIGSDYIPAAAGSGACCGVCAAARCVVGSQERRVGETWSSADHCTTYTCHNLNGSLQVESSNETCPEIPEDLKKQYIYKDTKIAGKCCSKQEAIACLYFDTVFQVGENWTSPTNPCESYQCIKNKGKVEKITTVQGCDADCQAGSEYFPAAAGSGKCCGSCKPVACVVDGHQHPIGDKWTSVDFCTNYTCLDLNGTLQVQTSNETCTVPRSTQFLYKENKLPGKCCSEYVPTACRVGDKIYQVGENWTSTTDPCVSYLCKNEEGKVQKLTTQQFCDDDCEIGWEYFPAAAGSGKCCGSCKPVACVVDGHQHPIGEKWTSADFCTNYTCLDLNGTLQVQTSNETCPEISESLRKEFVYEEKSVPGKCCKVEEPIACRDGNKIYQEGQIWPSAEPCRNYTCSRSGGPGGHLTRGEAVQSCDTHCERGWGYNPPLPGECCGKCQQTACIANDGALRPPGSTWLSADNCTTYSCDRDGGSLCISSFSPVCPPIDGCEPQNLYNDTNTCCQLCRPTSGALSRCVPTAVPPATTIGLVRVVAGRGLVCVNKEPLHGFKECHGSCDSGTTYNNQTGGHDSRCECCTATRYAPLMVALACADGSMRPHRVATPISCQCSPCGPSPGTRPTKGGYTGYGVTRNEPPRVTRADEDEFAIPQMFARFGEDNTKPPR